MILWCPVPNPFPLFDPPVGGSNGPIGWGPGKVVWLPPSQSPQLDNGTLEGDARLLAADTTSNAVVAMQSDGTAIAAQNVSGVDCGGDEVDATLATNLFSTTQAWLSAVEPSRNIPGASMDAVAISLDGTTLTTAAQTSGATLVGVPVVNPVGDPPAARTDYVATFSRVAGGVFVAGGTALSDHSILHDVWFQSIGGAWANITPHGGVAALGTIRAMTYSFDDHKLWLIDEVPVNIGKLHLTQARLLRAAPGNGIELLASWLTLGLADREYLSVDHDGAILATFALKNRGFVTARVVVDVKTNSARVPALYVDALDTLHGAPFVSPVGYGFFVQHGTKDEVLRIRKLPSLSVARTFGESLCQ
jgi:hypothetical protein